MNEKGGLGRALRRMMGVVPPSGDRPRGGGESVLMNATRLRIFQVLCNRPCSHVRAISREVGVAPPSVLWHLEKLLGRGLVRRQSIGNRAVYYPSDMLEAGDVELLAFLESGHRGRAIKTVLDHPGISQGELVRLSGANGHALGALAGKGLMQMVKDGRHRRYYPATLLRQKQDHYEHRARRFRQSLLSRLADEGLAPETGRYDRHHLEVRVTLGTSEENLLLLCNPFSLEARMLNRE